MAVGIYFSPESMSAQAYDDVVKRLADAGHGAPAGRLYHIAFNEGNGLHVFDVWDSRESFEAFGQALTPILGEVGLDPGEPHFSEIHNIIEG